MTKKNKNTLSMDVSNAIRFMANRVPHFVKGEIHWNAKGRGASRPCSTNARDFINLGDCERPKTSNEKKRYDILHGMLMGFPTDDVAWFALEMNGGNHKKFIAQLEVEFAEVIEALRREHKVSGDAPKYIGDCC